MQQKLKAFSALGKKLRISLNTETVTRAINSNNWFTETSIQQAVEGISYMLEEEKLEQWIGEHPESEGGKTIGLIMAGNIPMVGFHDLLCILMSGNKALIKLSSKDSVLIPWITDLLIQEEPEFKAQIEFVEQLRDFDAIIATGSDNSSNYFNQYFSKFPHIIRKNRISCAILTGNESADDLKELGKDIFSFYGLGCRNVSKIYVPSGYTIDTLLQHLDDYSWVIDHHKYANNYDYNKSIYLVNKEPHYDNGFLMIKESDQMVSPISVVYLEYYQSMENLLGVLEDHKEKIQCLVSTSNDIEGKIDPGKAQSPEVWDYADHVDTMKFLSEL